MEKNNFYIITGGPGSGKSTLIEALKKRCAKTMPESGRAIIQNMKQIGAEHLLQERKELFAELMLSWDLRTYNEINNDSILTFFDRGIPDIISFLRLNDITVPEHLTTAANELRYNKLVFIAPPWKAIYKKDAERKQDWEEAVRTYHAMRFVYLSLGYELIELPFVSVSKRVDFVLKSRRQPTISKEVPKKIRKHLNRQGIPYRKNVSQSGSIYYRFTHLYEEYTIRIADHPMSPVHPLVVEQRIVFNVGTHKFVDGSSRDCCDWIDSIVAGLMT